EARARRDRRHATRVRAGRTARQPVAERLPDRHRLRVRLPDLPARPQPVRARVLLRPFGTARRGNRPSPQQGGHRQPARRSWRIDDTREPCVGGQAPEEARRAASAGRMALALERAVAAALAVTVFAFACGSSIVNGVLLVGRPGRWICLGILVGLALTYAVASRP